MTKAIGWCVFLLLLAVPAPAQQMIRIASFNIQNFGASKMNKPEVVAELAEIIRDYDLVAVQEVSNKPQRVPYAFLNVLNQSANRSFGMLLSERSGREADDKNSQEQYLFYYDTETIRPAGMVALFVDSEDDLFQREPYAARFEVIGSNVSFVLITVHTDPDIALEEITALDDVNEWAEDIYPTEEDFITLGDFNAGKAFASVASLDALDVRASPYSWLTPDTVNTTLGQSQQAHDRIVVKGPVGELVTDVGVDRRFTDPQVSDHWPVFLVLQIDGAADDVGITEEGGSATSVRIVRLLPNPEGTDRGQEVVVLRNGSGATVSLDQWRLVDSKGKEFQLSGSISSTEDLHIIVPSTIAFILRNAGDRISLFNGDTLIHQISYQSSSEDQFVVIQ